MLPQFAGFWCLAVLLIVCVIVSCKYDKHVEEIAMTDKACRDVSLIGVYDNTLQVSVMYWVYSIEVLAYRKNKSSNLYPMFCEWNDKYNHDVKNLIRDAIEMAHTKFLGKVDEARQEEREPDFRISSEFNYHNYPSTFCFNDYINPDAVVYDIDKILGGELHAKSGEAIHL